MTKYVLIDGNNFMQIAIFAAKRQLKEDDRVDLVMARILHAMIGKLQRSFGYFSTYCVVWDTQGGSSWRKSLDAGYKAGRTQHADLVYLTDTAKEIVEAHFIPSVEVERSEADDILYALAEQLKKRSPCHITIVSRDKDLVQIVQDGHADQIWDCVSKKYLEIPSYSIVDYKALVGDKSDGLKGVDGVGDKRAKKMMAEGFDRSIISETRKLVHIPSNPRYPEYQSTMAKWVEWADQHTN